jgi:putative addiction module killer protein
MPVWLTPPATVGSPFLVSREGQPQAALVVPSASLRLPLTSTFGVFFPVAAQVDIRIYLDTLSCMNTFLRSDDFDAWLASLKDKVGRARIVHRIRAAEHGNFGDCEPVGEGVSEMRVHFGPGYRVYFTRRGDVVYLLLLGGNKSSQKRDIKRAIEMARAIEKE